MGDAAAIHMQLAQGGARVEGANEGGDAVAADARVAREAQLVDAVWLRAERLRESGGARNSSRLLTVTLPRTVPPRPRS